LTESTDDPSMHGMDNDTKLHLVIYSACWEITKAILTWFYEFLPQEPCARSQRDCDAVMWRFDVQNVARC